MDDYWSWLVKNYGPVLLGLFIGTATRYGMNLREGRKITLKGIVADILLLGMSGLMAVVATRALDITGSDQIALCSALFAIASDRATRIVRDAFVNRLRATAEALANDESKNE